MQVVVEHQQHQRGEDCKNLMFFPLHFHLHDGEGFCAYKQHIDKHSITLKPQALISKP
jgi:hypothetical protein